MSARSAGDRGTSVSLREALSVWAYVGLNSFGGPAGQIAVMHRVLVDTRHWISEQRFLHALNYCMLLPGPEAHQLSVYIGWLMHGVRGGLLAGTLFILPGFLAILALSVLYVGYQDTTFVQAIFYGLKSAILAVVAAAVLRVGRRALTGPIQRVIAIASFVALYFLALPFPLVILAAGLIGLLAARRPTGERHGASEASLAATPSGPSPRISDEDGPALRPSGRRALTVLLLGAALWLGPLVLLVGLFGRADIYASQALFFSGAAIVTFGGAYAVLTYVAQQVVEVYGWLTPAEMLDGLAMAETTPGPLIMVVEFVGFLSAARNPGAFDPIVAGLLGALLVTWVTFVPSFLWIFVGAPYAEYVRRSRRLAGALGAITAAVVGAILNLAVWFALHALFGVVDTEDVGPIRLQVPELASLDVAAAIIAIGAAVAIFRLRCPTLVVLALAGLVGAAWFLVR